MLDDTAVGQHGLGDGDHLVEIRVRGVEDGELVGPVALGVVLRLALVEAQVALHLEYAGEQLAQQQEDEPEVREQDAGLPPFQLEAVGVGGDEVDEEERCRRKREEGRGADPATTIPPRLPIPYAEIRNPNAAAPWEKRV